MQGLDGISNFILFFRSRDTYYPFRLSKIIYQLSYSVKILLEYPIFVGDYFTQPVVGLLAID
jgi:hypothetical protein